MLLSSCSAGAYRAGRGSARPRRGLSGGCCRVARVSEGFVAPAPQTPRSEEWAWIEWDEARRDAAERPITTTRYEARLTYATKPSTRRNGGSARPDSDTTVQYAPGAGTRPLPETDLTFGRD